MLEPIGSLLELRARAPGCHGIPRRRRTPIRRGEIKREPRERHKRARRRHDRGSARVALMRDLLAGPATRGFNVSQEAGDRGLPWRTLQGYVVALEQLGAVERSDNAGGRGRGLRLSVNHIALARLLRNYDPSPTPLSEDLRSGSASRFAAGPDGRGGAAPPAPRRREIKWPVDLAELRAEFHRTQRCQDLPRRMAGWQRLLRRTAGYRGLALRDSKLIAAAWATWTAPIGKASKREACLLPVITRLLHEKATPPMTWPALRTWFEGCEKWANEYHIERRIRDSSSAATCSPGSPGARASSSGGSQPGSGPSGQESARPAGPTLPSSSGARPAARPGCATSAAKNTSAVEKQLPLWLAQWCDRMQSKVSKHENRETVLSYD